MSCSPNLKCLKLLSCKLTPLQIVVGMIPSSSGPDLAVAAAHQRQVLEDGNAMPSLVDRVVQDALQSRVQSRLIQQDRHV